MTPNILYTKSKFHWLRDYPLEPKWIDKVTENVPDPLVNYGPGIYMLRVSEHKAAIEKSLASALEFVEGDQFAVGEMCWQLTVKDDRTMTTPHLLREWTPTDGQLFTVEGIEVEIKTLNHFSGHLGPKKDPIAQSGVEITKRQVVRLKAKQHLPKKDESDRDWTEDFNHENGNYQCICRRCGLYFYGHKRRVICKKCDEAGEPIQDSAPPEPKVEWSERLNDLISSAYFYAYKKDSTLENWKEEYKAELQAIADKLNQSTTKQ